MFDKNHIFRIITAMILLISAGSESVIALSAREILKSADEARGNVEGISWKVTIRSETEQDDKSMTFDVKARGFDIMAENLAPATYKGNRLIMLNGSMWFYKPGLSKPVPISRRQKLMGNAVYGDIAATNYADDYTPVQLPDESIDGEPCYAFDLQSTSRKSTYDRIIYWISKDRLVGIRAEYYTISGKKFKTAVMKYENSVQVAGKKRPFISDLVITDALVSRNTTILQLKDPFLGALPDYHFNLNLMRK